MIKIACALAVVCLGAACANAQSLKLEDVAKQISTASLVNNAATLLLFEMHCATSATPNAGALKSEINKYAAVGEFQVGRDAFRKLFYDELAVRRRQLDSVGAAAWCERVAVQMSLME